MTSALPSTVDCLLQSDLFKPELIRSRIPLQQPAEDTDEHLIRVHSVAPCANELNWVHDFPDGLPKSRPNVPCFDFTGTVIRAPKSSAFQPGAEVFATSDYKFGGHAREYTIARESELALAPKTLSWAERASVPISALTAFQALFVHAGLAHGWRSPAEKAKNVGKRVLVTAAAGGVGVWVLQLARAAGIDNIVAVCGPKNVDFVKSLGATAVIDYRSQSIGEYYENSKQPRVDLAIDMIGGQTAADCWTAIKDDGLLISIHSRPEPHRPAGKREEQGLFFILEGNGDQLAEIAQEIDTESFRAFVDSEWPLDQWEEAWQHLDKGHARGKVVITFPT